jgi:2',3'-cyclic-nucleotide 2'-phosphodiesterase (5'-nucleotidase family)
LVVQFDDNGKVISLIDGDIIHLSNPATPPIDDPPIVQQVRDLVLAAYSENYKPLNTSLGINLQTFNNTREIVRYSEAPVGNLVTDAMCWETRKQYPQVCACVDNGGSFRDFQPAGPITAEDLYRIMPFAGKQPNPKKNSSRFQPTMVDIPQFPQPKKLIVSQRSPKPRFI